MQSDRAKNSYEVYAASARHEMLPFVPADAHTILDVGCSVGNFGELLKAKRGAEVWGVEADARAAEIASRKLDKVIHGPFDSDLDLPPAHFDCIVFNDVLEHMVDPYGALEYAKKFLCPQGRVVASIPNVRYFGNMWLLTVHKSWEYVDSGILDRTHLRFFTEKSIRSMFENAGYNIESIIGINGLEVCDAYFLRKFRILNFLTVNKINDMQWLQFAVVGKPHSS